MAAALKAVKQFRMRELAPALKADSKLVNASPKVRNPFLPWKNPESGRWAPPKYSLRRQADLVKQARASGTVHLLPPGPKFSAKELSRGPATAAAPPAEAEAPASSSPTEAEAAAEAEPWWRGAVEWQGEMKVKEVKGSDVGNRLYAGKKRMFKGHKWERTQEKRTWKRKMLMKDMEARIERFRTNYRRKTPSPVSPARPVSYSKLPF